MCGLAGELSFDRPPRADAVAAMAERLRHRGPDAAGQVERPCLALAHRRLSVIDPTPINDQPQSDAEGRLWLVFNGEIYNFRELRRELEGHGARFRTRGDTEVVLESYKRWELGCFERFNGMFALALWDEPRRRLVLARDRAGEKPLYYQALADGGLVFASDLAALRRHPRTSQDLDAAAVGRYLSLGYLPGAESILRDVRRLPPATYLLAEKGRAPVERCYWDLAAHFRDKGRFADETEAAAAVARILDDAVVQRLVADVPLGAFLSGGIDSSAVVEAMHRGHGGEQCRTYSVGFHEPGFSELPQAAQVASALGVAHRQRTVDPDLARELPRILSKVGEPFADTSVIPTYFLAAFARREVTVCLSGDGGDELFAGYDTYRANRLHRRLRFLPGPLTRGAAAVFSTVWPASFGKVAFDEKARRFLSGLHHGPRRAHHHWRLVFQPEEKDALLRLEHRSAAADDGFACFDRHFDEVADCHPLDQALYVDFKTWLPDDVLLKVDRATMAHSLESRAPFLDPRLIEAVAAMRPEWKLRGGRGKHVLRRALRDRLPKGPLERRKRGFNAPVSRWLAGPLEALARDALGSGPLADWVQPAAVERLWAEHKQGRRDRGLELFALTCLALWMWETP